MTYLIIVMVTKISSSVKTRKKSYYLQLIVNLSPNAKGSKGLGKIGENYW